MFNNIIEPNTHKIYNIQSKLGKQLLKKYIKLFYAGSNLELTLEDQTEILNIQKKITERYKSINKAILLEIIKLKILKTPKKKYYK